MKKVIMYFICLLIIGFILISYMNRNDKRYISKLEKNIIKNTDVKKINYINKYNGYYIVLDDENIYLFNKDYVELLCKDINLIHENTNNYDIIYKDEYLMYLNDYVKNGVLVYEYYDINNYKLIDKVFVGGMTDE